MTDEKGFLCGKILGDLGADVIKIEPPCGDRARNIGPFYHNVPDPEKSLFWFAYNTSKRGITLNIESREGKEIFKNLVRSAGFVLESFCPGYMGNLGLGYQDLSKINRRIIMTSITPFGQTGPYREYKGSDIIATATGGLMFISGDPDRAPLRFSVEQSYAHAGAQATVATLIAHHYRELTGEGQYIDVSMQECIVATLFCVQQYWDLNKYNMPRQGVRSGRGKNSPQVIFPCKDGCVAWRIFTAEQAPKLIPIVDWMDEEGVAGGAEKVDWAKEDMFKVNQQQMEAWEKPFAKFFLTHTKKELCDEAYKRGAMLFPVNTPEDLLNSEQLSARDFWVEVEHPKLETSFLYPGAPFKSNETSWRISRRAPCIGEHNKEIYEKELGLSKEQLIILKQANVI